MSVTIGFELVTIRTVISNIAADATEDTETIFHETVRLAMPQDHTLAEYLEIVNSQKHDLLTALDYDPEKFSLEIESIEIDSDEVLLLVDDDPEELEDEGPEELEDEGPEELEAADKSAYGAYGAYGDKASVH